MYYSLATATDTVSRLSDNDVEKRKDSIKKQLYYYDRLCKKYNCIHKVKRQ